jgi:hypothetical protein
MATVAKIEYDVHTDSWLTNGAAAATTPAPEAAVPSARALWRQAVGEVADRARAALPEANGRIDGAVAIVLQGDVALNADGTAEVGSQSDPQRVYHVNGACECQDAPRAPHGGMCKHRIARGMAIRAQERLEQLMRHHDAERVQSAEDRVQKDPSSCTLNTDNLTLPEAPASANAFVVIDGHRVQITVRGTTVQGVLSEIRTVLRQFPATPTPPPAPPQAEEAPGDAKGFCAVHECWMKWNDPKPGDKRPGWYSHKAEDGSWCRGNK